MTRQPRHNDLDLEILLGDIKSETREQINETFQTVCREPQPKRVGGFDSFVYDEEEREAAELKELKKKLSNLQIVSSAKITKERIYSSAYHPELTKDLLFFGGCTYFPKFRPQI